MINTEKQERKELIKELLKTTLKDRNDWRGLTIRMAIEELIDGVLSDNKHFTIKHYKQAIYEIGILLGEVENDK